VAVLTLASGKVQKSGTRDTFILHGCKSFEVNVDYLDNSEHVARSLRFDAVADGAKEGPFNLSRGKIMEGANSSPIIGTIQRSLDGNLLRHFSGAVGGQQAYLSEVMSFSGSNELTRTIQMSASHLGNNDISLRIVHDKIAH
jgi:hypothetical protein